MISIYRGNLGLFATIIIFSALLCHAHRVVAEAAMIFVLSSSEWNVPRTTETILRMPALQQTIQAYNKQPNSTIQIQYPGGDEGTLWASELRSWLVALGVGSRHIELLPGSRKAGQLELEVLPPTINSAPRAEGQALP